MKLRAYLFAGLALLLLAPQASATPTISFMPTALTDLQSLQYDGGWRTRTSRWWYGYDIQVGLVDVTGAPGRDYLRADITEGRLDFDTLYNSLDITGTIGGIPVLVTGVLNGWSWTVTAGAGWYAFVSGSLWGTYTLNDELSAYLGLAPGTVFDFVFDIHSSQMGHSLAGGGSGTVDYYVIQSATPEPTSLLLLASGLLGGVVFKRFRRRG